MLRLSEWLPNPDGKDAGAEWFEVANPGSVTVELAGWSVGTGSKRALLSGEVPPGGYVKFDAARLGLTLKNTEGKLELRDPSGALVDAASFLGSAPSGRSFSRVGELFRFATATPGAPNPEAAIVKESYPLGRPLHPAASLPEAAGMAVLTGLLAAAAIGYILHHAHDLHHLFFPGDGTPGNPDLGHFE